MSRYNLGVKNSYRWKGKITKRKNHERIKQTKFWQYTINNDKRSKMFKWSSQNVCQEIGQEAFRISKEKLERFIGQIEVSIESLRTN